MSLKTYLEWMPERIKTARAAGYLDKAERHSPVPDWYWELISYLSYYEKAEVDVKKNQSLQHYDECRVVFYNNNYWTTRHGIHDVIVLYLVHHEGLRITEEQFEHWNALSKDDVPFLCCHQQTPFLFLSESYVNHPPRQAESFRQQAEKQTGLIFIPAQIHTQQADLLIDEFFDKNPNVPTRRQMAETFFQTGKVL